MINRKVKEYYAKFAEIKTLHPLGNTWRSLRLKKAANWYAVQVSDTTMSP
jgi:hypothetical protein